MPTKEWRKRNPERQKLLAKASNARRWLKIKDDQSVKDKNAAKSRAWYERNRERALLNKKARNALPEVKQRRRNNAHIKLYGITIEQRDALFAKQGFKCAICGCGDMKRRWELDHCHATGVVRGILCPGCNLMLGHAKDRPEILTAAAVYLSENK